MKTLLLLFLSLFFSTIVAQPVITRDWIPDIGETFDFGFSHIIDSPQFGPGPAGPAQVWDFSDAGEPDSVPLFDNYPVKFVSASESQHSDDFPEANAALIPEDGENDSFPTLFFILDNSQIANVGLALSDGSYVRYTDPEVGMMFPFSFQDQFTDTYAAESSFFGFMNEFSGTSEVTYDGFGTLITPLESISNVARLRNVRMEMDTFDIGGGLVRISETIDTTYNWIRPDIFINLGLASYSINIQTSTNYLAGAPVSRDTTRSYSFSYDATSLSTDDFISGADKLKVDINNPASDHLNISLTVPQEQHSATTVKILDINGRVVQEATSFLPAGDQQITIPLRIPSGMHILYIQSGPYRGVQKFVKP